MTDTTNTPNNDDYLSHIDFEKHAGILDEKMTYLATRINDGTLSESDTALYHAILATNVLSSAVTASLRETLKAMEVQQKSIQALKDSQQLMCEYLQRMHGIDLQQALLGLPKVTDSESDHG